MMRIQDGNLVELNTQEESNDNISRIGRVPWHGTQHIRQH